MTNFHLFTQKLLTLDESSQEEAIKRFCKVFNEPIFNSFLRISLKRTSLNVQSYQMYLIQFFKK